MHCTHTASQLVWITQTPAVPFSPARTGHCTVVFNNVLLVMGGSYKGNLSTPYTPLGDVWRSTDGLTWTLSNASARFAPRTLMDCAVFGSQVVLVGGILLYPTGPAVVEPLNDVWGSSDAAGASWALRGVGGFAGRGAFRVLSFLSKLWVVAGGGRNGTYLNDVWSSTTLANGSWTQATSAAAFSARCYFGLASLNGRMWLVGGVSGIGTPSPFNDVCVPDLR